MFVLSLSLQLKNFSAAFFFFYFTFFPSSTRSDSSSIFSSVLRNYHVRETIDERCDRKQSFFFTCLSFHVDKDRCIYRKLLSAHHVTRHCLIFRYRRSRACTEEFPVEGGRLRATCSPAPGPRRNIASDGLYLVLMLDCPAPLIPHIL